MLRAPNLRAALPSSAPLARLPHRPCAHMLPALPLLLLLPRRPCAGTGGAGPTIMETTLLLAGEDVVAYKWVGRPGVRGRAPGSRAGLGGSLRSACRPSSRSTQAPGCRCRPPSRRPLAPPALPRAPPCARRDGARQVLPPVSNRRVVDFGAGVGRRSVYLYNLPEVTSGHQVRGALCAFVWLDEALLWSGAACTPA